MDKKGVEKAIIVIIVLAIAALTVILIANRDAAFDGKAMAEPPHTHVEHVDNDVCGDGNCGGGEDYQNCPEDCCGEENDQVRTEHSCCEGLKAVSDICEFEWPPEEEEGENVLPFLPPPPMSTEAIAEPPTTPVEPVQYCWFCVDCGDGECSAHETGENCALDCSVCGNGICEPPAENYSNCPQDCCVGAGVRGPSPLACCAGLKIIDPCEDMDPMPMYCMTPIVQEACINCGDGKCDSYETIKNCPQDCLGNETNCSDLPPLEMEVIDRKDSLKFIWEANSVIPGSKLYLDISNECVGEDCKLKEEKEVSTGYQPSQPGEYSIDMPQENLQFYQIISKVKIGKGNCEPECMFEGTRSEGWYDPCAEQLLKYDSCGDKQVHCCFAPSKSQGWYDAGCDKATTEDLINYDSGCLVAAKLCEQKSNIMVKYTQEFSKPMERAALTGINWLWFLNAWGVQTSEDLLKTEVFDYVAYWDAEEQQQRGTAEGDPHLVCDFGKGGGKGGSCYLERVFTGVFDLEMGKPYFVSMKKTNEERSYVGNLLGPVTFELKYVPETFSVNYIALPLNTRIKKASDLCDINKNGGIPINIGENLVWWDPLTQEEKQSSRPCEVIMEPGSSFDFPLEPGKVYKVIVTEDANWQQI